jgi:hypothetical protein
MLTRLLHLIRHNVIALIALFVALGGTSYAALNLPANSVGARQLKNQSVTAAKLDPSSVAATVRAWATLQWFGTWQIESSSRDIHVSNASTGELVTWRHTRFAHDCMASVTPIRNLSGEPGTSSSFGYVTTSFDGPAGRLEIDGLAPSGAAQVQSANVLIMCPTPGSRTK